MTPGEETGCCTWTLKQINTGGRFAKLVAAVGLDDLVQDVYLTETRQASS